MCAAFYLLVFVEFFQIVDGHLVDADALGLLAVHGVADDAALEVRARHDGQLERPGEALVALGVVVLERDLQINRFDKFALLALHIVTVVLDGLARRVG